MGIILIYVAVGVVHSQFVQELFAGEEHLRKVVLETLLRAGGPQLPFILWYIRFAKNQFITR